MTAAEYRRRRAAGMCVWSEGCTGKPKRGRLCAKHLRYHNRQQAVNRRAKYLAAKLAGRCVITSCKNSAGEARVTCDAHAAAQAKRDAQPKRAAQLRESTKHAREAYLKAGLCGHCGGEPRTGKLLGDKCKAEMRARGLRRRQRRAEEAGRAYRRLTCTECGRVGCRADRCDYREPLPELHATDFMRSGTSNLGAA